jgi:hypothetical protein
MQLEHLFYLMECAVDQAGRSNYWAYPVKWSLSNISMALVIAVDFLGAACGILCMGIAVLSGDVSEHGRSIWLASIPRISRPSRYFGGIYLIKTSWSLSRSILPLLNDLYKLDHLRSKYGENDHSGKDCAWLSLINASTVLNKVSPARSKL